MHFITHLIVGEDCVCDCEGELVQIGTCNKQTSTCVKRLQQSTLARTSISEEQLIYIQLGNLIETEWKVIFEHVGNL